ncbi:unnamed protein product [Acanthosepion pharaonis]|uniref:Uncharacterized protein n=1 Tax=Acanthosepion pharaonis TaxID=158019 RepID=A0A812B413_ACAPH|nr:unnamed protein product [Sepia pharaonis]
MAAIKKITNQKFLQGLNSIYDEVFDFNLDSEDEEDEVFTGDFCFKEKCKSAVVNDLCNVEPFAELTSDQWVHMKEQADFMIFLLWEDKQDQHLSNTPDSAMIKNSHNIIIQSPQVTSSPAMNTRSKRKMQLTSGSPYKVSPLQDITNRSIIKPSPQIQKLVSSSLDTSTDFALYDQLGLVNPMKLNFDDVEHSPKKSRCLNPYFTIQDSPLITDEAWDVLVSSPDKIIPKKEESKEESPQILQPKRKCLISTPPISKIGSVKPAESSLNGNQDAPKTRLALPSKFPSNLIKTDTGKPMSRIPSKGPLKAFPTLGKVGEMKQSEISKLPLSGKSKLKMFSPVKSRIPQKNLKNS